MIIARKISSGASPKLVGVMSCHVALAAKIADNAIARKYLMHPISWQLDTVVFHTNGEELKLKPIAHQCPNKTHIFGSSVNEVKKFF